MNADMIYALMYVCLPMVDACIGYLGAYGWMYAFDICEYVYMDG
jgi:hypothetical protein